MCKVMMIAGIKPEKIPLVAQLAKVMAKNMSQIEEDGVGYAAITKDCQIYGEKWLVKEDAFLVHNQPPPDAIHERISEMFGTSIEMDKKLSTGQVYLEFGLRNAVNIQNTVAVVLHARKATIGDKTLANVHPFVSLGNVADGEPQATALIHNGSISNHEKLTKVMSECDSEVLLHEYLANQMYHNPWGIEQLAKTVVGTYTVGVLGSQNVDDVWVPYLDIFKSNKELIGGYVPELETFVYSTTKYALEESLKTCGMTLEKDFKFKDGYLHRIDAITGLATAQPISFSTSSSYMNNWNRQHENSKVTRKDGEIYPFGPKPQSEDDIDATNSGNVDGAKKHFERRHPALFTTPYLEANITAEEKAFFETMDKDQKTDRQALRLVSAALGMGA